MTTFRSIEQLEADRPSRFTKRQRLAVWNKYDGHCAYCGVTISLEEMQVDHIFPKSSGGTDSFDNLNPACRPCNYRKDTFTIEGFREQLTKGHQVLMRDNATYRNLLRYGIIQHDPKPLRFYFETFVKGNE